MDIGQVHYFVLQVDGPTPSLFKNMEKEE